MEFRWGASQDDHRKWVIEDIALTATMHAHTFNDTKIKLLLARYNNEFSGRDQKGAVQNQSKFNIADTLCTAWYDPGAKFAAETTTDSLLRIRACRRAI